MVEVIHAPQEYTVNDCLIIGDNIEDIVEFCLPKIMPKSRAFYQRELTSDLNNGYRSLIDVHAGMGTHYAVIYVDPNIITITLKQNKNEI